MIEIDLSRQQELDPDSKAIEQINFTGYLNWHENVNDNTIIFFIIEEVKENIFDKELWKCCNFTLF